MKKTVLALCMLVMMAGYAQQPPQLSVTDFAPIESQGGFPADLKAAVNTPKSAKEYNPFLVEMIKQGKILYGSEMNSYLNTIADNLLANYPQLRAGIHIYILQTPSVNAYSLRDGTILVTMGMLAQVTNESELAFVLAHEIAHHSEHHDLNDSKSKTKKRDIVDEYMRYHSHSRDQEFEADRVGLTRYMAESPYSLDILDGIFDVLLYSDLPFDEIPYPRTEVETDFYHFPDNYFLKTVSNIPDRSNMLDTLLTHPNVEKRRTVAKSLASKLSRDGRKTFVQPEEQFVRLRDAARFACIDYFLLSHKYDKAIYNIFVLQRQFPDNLYLDRCQVTAWYGAAKHKIQGQTSTFLEPYREVEGEMQQVSYFMGKLSRNEYAALALRKAWAAMQKHPGDDYLKGVTEDIISDLFVKLKMRYTDFCDYPQGTTLEEIAQEGGDTVQQQQVSNKYDRIKQQSMSVKVLPEPKFKTVNYMLVDIHSDSLFRVMVNDAVVNAETAAILEEVSDGRIGTERSLIVLTPDYHTYDKDGFIKSASRDRRDSEQLQRMMCRAITRMGYTPVTLDMDFTAPVTEKYNDHVKLCNWRQDFNRSIRLNMRPHTSEYLDDIAASLGAHKLCYVNVTDSPGRKRFYFSMFYTLWVVPVFPYSLPAVVTFYSLKPHDIAVNCLFLDMMDGKVESAGHYNQSDVVRKAYVNGYVYRRIERYLR